jgi:light-regulated signal transduction histidine kinase (bacteriophytochrome)
MDYEGRKVRVAAVMDISERKRAEETLRQRTVQLEAANRELEAFSYSVSHDLRSPLRGIDGWSLALVEDYGGRLDGKASEYLGRIRHETKRMDHLIDDMLHLSRVARAELKLQTVDLTGLSRSIAERLMEANPGRTVIFEAEPGLRAEGDPYLIEIMLTNLLTNAWKFTGRREQAKISLVRTEEGFCVRDNGVGFNMKYADKMFVPFQRLHRQSEFPGSGIGLAIVQRIAARHGGRVWAEAEPEKGAAIHFTIGGDS